MSTYFAWAIASIGFTFTSILLVSFLVLVIYDWWKNDD